MSLFRLFAALPVFLHIFSAKPAFSQEFLGVVSFSLLSFVHRLSAFPTYFLFELSTCFLFELSTCFSLNFLPASFLTFFLLSLCAFSSCFFYELPTDTPIVVQNQQRLAKVGNEIVRVKNHPEDHVPTVMERFEALAMQQSKESGAKSKKLSKDRDTEERSITPRRSSRNKKPTEIYQAGLNSMQASSNPRGYVDSSGRYRSYSRDRFPRDQSRQRSPSRQDRYKRSPSRQDRYQRQPSRDSYPRQDRYSRQPTSAIAGLSGGCTMLDSYYMVPVVDGDDKVRSV